jgi:hypothetical protein
VGQAVLACPAPPGVRPSPLPIREYEPIVVKYNNMIIYS